jgi:hypothetical protein
MITVGEMIEILQEFDPKAVLVMSGDSEGNHYSPLTGFDPNCIYVPISDFYGEVHLATISEEERKHGFTDEDVYTGADGLKAIVLVPLN